MSGQHHLRDKWWPPETEAARSASGAQGPAATGADDEAILADEWTTGDEPMTGPQATYLDALADDVGVDVSNTMTKAEASDLIDDLQRRNDSDEAEEEGAER